MSDEAAQPLNWVARKHRRETMLEQGTAALWHDVRAAIRDACDSFREHYGPVECNFENGKKVMVLRGALQVVVTFEPAPLPRIAVTCDSKPTFIAFGVDDDGAFMGTADKRDTPDQVSERILAPVFFPKAAIRRGPAQNPPSSQWG